MFGTEKLTRTLTGNFFNYINALTTAVVSLSRITLGIFVCEQAAHCSHNCRRNQILAGDQFQIPTLAIGKLKIDGATIITIVLGVIIMVALQLFVTYTKQGKAMRAVSEDKEASILMGINVNSTITLTFAIGSGLAAVAALMYCISYPQVSPMMGAMLGLKAFVAAVLGGIGSIPGAMIGGIAIGLCECFVSAIGLSAWKDAVTFAILIIVLLVKPTGFLGRKVQEKV